MMNKITAYTDGSAVLKYPYKGGSGVYIKTPTKEFKFRKGFCNTKTGRCELHAVLICLRTISDKKALITIYSDSMYVVNTCNEWIWNWEKTLFSDKKNVDLLEQLIAELRLFRRRPVLRHVKGHQTADDEHTQGNAIADDLACYSTQKSWEVDVPFEGLSEIEKGDFEEVNGKLYFIKD